MEDPQEDPSSLPESSSTHDGTSQVNDEDHSQAMDTLPPSETINLEGTPTSSFHNHEPIPGTSQTNTCLESSTFRTESQSSSIVTPSLETSLTPSSSSVIRPLSSSTEHVHSIASSSTLEGYRQGTQHKKQCNMTSELYFLVWKFLSEGPCCAAKAALEREIDLHSLMPPRVDWMGKLHPQTLSQVNQRHPHITLTHLRDICMRIPGLLDKEIPAAIPGVPTLLGNGRQSLLRTTTSNRRKLTLSKLSTTVNGTLPMYPPSVTISSHRDHVPVNMTDFVAARQLTGMQCIKTISPTAMYTKVKRHRRLLGHLNSVYCVCFDRSGRYIFTGADDHLVKIWSAVDGRLLATLRGHQKPITDFTVNLENTLLATGSVDKTIRIWDLRTTEPLAILSGHASEIASLNFCPFVKSLDNHHGKRQSQLSHQRWLVSTANDGQVCFWSFDLGTKEFNPKPIKFDEKSRAGCHILCSSFSPGGVFLAVGSTDCCVRVYHVDGKLGPVKILEIEEHTDLVDSIQFANRSTRFVSGSKDGVAHIWSYEKQKWKNIPLKMEQRLPSDPVLDEFKKIKVNMISWTCDDAFVITPASDFTIKIWNSLTGKLLHSLKHHENDAFVVESHPHDPRIFVTGAHDGRLVLWDVCAGKPIKTFLNSVEGHDPAAILDGKWARDGLSFACGDIMGHLIICGFGESEPFKKVPDNVFFHTDYRPLQWDRNGFVIDEQTQCPPHLMPPPFLVDIDGNPHAAKFQRLVPGREHLKDDQLVPYIVVQEPQVIPAIQPTIDDRIRELQQQNPEPNNPVNVPHPGGGDVAVPVAQEPQVPFVGEAAPVAGPSSGNPVMRRRNPSVSDSNRNRAAAVPQVVNAGNAGVAQSNGNWQSRDGGSALSKSVWKLRSAVKPLSEDELKYAQRAANRIGDMETEFFERERRRRPVDIVCETTVIENTNSNEKMTRRKRRLYEQRQGLTIAQQSSNTRNHRNQLAQSALSRGIAISNSGRNTRSLQLIDDDLEDLEYDERAQSGADSWSHPSSSGSDDSDSDEESSDDSDDSRPRRGRRARGQVDEDHEDQPMDTSAETETTHPSDRDTPVAGPSRERVRRRPSTQNKRKSRPLTKRVQELFEEQNSGIVENKFRFPEWLSETEPKRTPYFPQKGDEVVYFRKGHLLYLEEVDRRPLDDLGYYVAPNLLQSFRNKLATAPPQVFGLVTDIKYDLKPPRVVEIRLTIMTEDGSLTKDNMALRFHDVPNVIDFIVLKQHYDAGMENNDYWRTGVRFRSIIDNLWWFGTVQERLEEPSPFQSILVKWDNDDVETMSPWDIERIENDADAAPGNLIRCGKPITEQERRNLMYQSDNLEDWPSGGMDAECDRILRGLDDIMQLDIAKPFNEPVDLTQIPLYAKTIPYLMDLSTFRERLNNRFYRRKDALKFDVSFIRSNAELFNETGTEIVTKARMLDHILKSFINDVNCVVTELINDTLGRREDFERIEEEKDDEGGHSSDDDYEEGDQLDDAGKKIKVKKSRPSPDERRSHYKEREIQAKKSWKKLCKELINELFDHEDSEPFRSAVNVLQYPDYNREIDTPMDLTTLKDELCSGNYENLKEFKKNLMLIFSNSRTFNTDRKAPIYHMTRRLEQYVLDRLVDISRGKSYEPEVSHKRKKGPTKSGVKSQSNRKTRARSPSGEPEAGPSGLCPGSSRSPQSSRTALNGNNKHDSDDTEEEEYEETTKSKRPVRQAVKNKNLADMDSGSETEVESEGEDKSNADSEATEIDENSRESYASTSSKENKKSKTMVVGKRKAPASKGKKLPAKKRKQEEYDSEVTEGDLTEEEESDDDFVAERTPSLSSTASLTDNDTDEAYNDYARKTRGPKTRRQGNRANNVNRPRTRNNGRVKAEPKYDDSEFEHDSVFTNQGQNVSSRGRVIKFKGRTSEQQVC